MNQPESEIPFRLLRLKMNEKLKDDFVLQPTKSEYSSFLADLVSHAFNLKVLVYHIPPGSFGVGQLKFSSYANQKEKEIKIFKMSDDCFMPLEELDLNKSDR